MSDLTIKEVLDKKPDTTNVLSVEEKEKYKLEEKEKGIRYCDLDRGCFNLCSKNNTSCDQCIYIMTYLT